METPAPRIRCRKRPVSFGNPGLLTYKGSVFCTDPDEEHPLPPGAEKVERMVALVDVPPDQVPEGILNLMRSHKPFIEHVRIVIAEPAEEDSNHHQNNHNNKTTEDPPERTTERSYLVLVQMASDRDADVFVEDLDGKPYTFLDETVTCSCHRVVALEGEDGVSLLNPMFAPRNNNNNNHQKPGGILPGEEVDSKIAPGEDTTPNCAVCLENIALHPQEAEQKPTVLTTVCNHTFHLDCLVKWQDSPCPVCRYDHSGLNETLSQCHTCGTTERNYVCLICGVVSCVGGAASSVASLHPGSTCLPVPSTAQRFTTSHAGQHYQETLHAYALDTETQHVWDFAGQGYVHRLLQNKEDGKLVEGNDPNNNNTNNLERSLTPGLSDVQEGEVVHRKLEGFASQYYTLLKSQLEQQRAFYEGRLEEIRRDFSIQKTNADNARTDLITVLKQERKQLSQRLVSIKRKQDKTREDAAFLKSMNESLEANKAPLERKIKQAQREQIESREMIQKYLPALEEKVTTLMLQLEESCGAPEASEADPTTKPPSVPLS